METDGYVPGGVEKRRNPLGSVIFYPSSFCNYYNEKKVKIALPYIADISS